MIHYPIIASIIVFKEQYNQNFDHCIMFYYLNIDILNELNEFISGTRPIKEIRK